MLFSRITEYYIRDTSHIQLTSCFTYFICRTSRRPLTRWITNSSTDTCVTKSSKCVFRPAPLSWIYSRFAMVYIDAHVQYVLFSLYCIISCRCLTLRGYDYGKCNDWHLSQFLANICVLLLTLCNVCIKDITCCCWRIRRFLFCFVFVLFCFFCFVLFCFVLFSIGSQFSHRRPEKTSSNVEVVM